MAGHGHTKGIDGKYIKMLLADGWYLARQKGSHRQFKHPTKPGLVTVPYEISKNIEKRIIKQAGLK